MIRNFADITLDSIAWSDTKHKLTFRHCPDLLRLSVREFGVLNPLIVTESTLPDRFTIVTGWLRFDAARESGTTVLPCHIYRNFPNKILLLCALFDNIGHRTMNALEQALTLKKLAEFYSRDEVIANFLPLLGFKPNAELWDRLVPLTGLAEEIQWAVADGTLDLDAALLLSKMPAKHPLRVYRLMRGLRVGSQVQREMAENFYHIWQREDFPPGALIDEHGWTRYEETPRGSSHSTEQFLDLPATPEKRPAEEKRTRRTGAQNLMAVRVRDELRRLRFPHLAEVQNTRAEPILPPEASVASARPGRSNMHRLEVRFRTPEQLRNALKKILSAEERGLFNQVLSRPRS